MQTSGTGHKNTLNRYGLNHTDSHDEDELTVNHCNIALWQAKKSAAEAGSRHKITGTKVMF